MNFVPKMPAPEALREVLSGLDAPAVVLDVQAGVLVAANAAGLDLWGGDPERLAVAALDRAMPGLARLRQHAGIIPRESAGEELLTFWTPRGLLCRPCSVRQIRQGPGGDVFLIVWPPPATTGNHPDDSRSGLVVPSADTNALGRIARRIREKAHAHTSGLASGLETPSLGTAPARGEEGDALADLAHELRTPLAAVIALAEIMTEEHLGPLPSERYRGYMRDIRDSARHGLALVDSLLEGEESANGEITLVYSEGDLNETARACIATVQPLAGKAGITLSTRLDEGLPRVVADVRCVKQILLNLLSNSIKYAGSGAQVTVRTAHELAGPAWIEVADNGPGIAPEIAASALEHVPRPAAAGRHASSGLGLPLSRRLARANGARLEIENANEGGAVVRVIFSKDRLVPV